MLRCRGCREPNACVAVCVMLGQCLHIQVSTSIRYHWRGVFSTWFSFKLLCCTSLRFPLSFSWLLTITSLPATTHHIITGHPCIHTSRPMCALPRVNRSLLSSLRTPGLNGSSSVILQRKQVSVPIKLCYPAAKSAVLSRFSRPKDRASESRFRFSLQSSLAPVQHT